jgi:hypothetical protein
MRKSLLILAAAAAVVACSKNDVANDIEYPELLIGFSDSHIGKQTKAGEIIGKTGLEQNGNTMEVWGWKTVTAGTSRVFNNQQVTYNTSSTQTTTNWEYSPLKYWDMEASNYSFYAVSPYSTKFAINETSRIISATGVETVQVLADKNGASQVTSTNTSAIDYLVAAIVSKKPKGNADDKDVSFTFYHILSKLTVKVKTSDNFNHSESEYPHIKLTGLSIKLQGMCPNYTQKTAGSVTADASTGDTWAGTEMSETSYTCFAVGGSVAAQLLTNNADNGEIASYLIAPTATGATPATFTYKATVDYDIYYSSSEREHFTATDKAISTLTSFVQNTDNTLTITIDPKAIYFDVTSVTDRAEGTAGEVVIQ